MTSDRCIFQGELGEIHLPDLLTFLDMIQRTGTLEVKRAAEEKRLFWDRGEIVHAESTLPAEQLGEYLRVNGWVTLEALARARGKLGPEAGDGELVKTLVDADDLDASFLPNAVRKLILDIVYSVFEWNEGDFRFVSTSEPHPEKTSLRTSVSNIIMEGSRRLDEWQRIRETFAHDGLFPHPSEDEDAVVNLPPLEREILEACDGTRPIAEIIQSVPHDQFTVLGSLLTLANAGVVVVAEEPRRPSGEDETIDVEPVDGLSEFERESANRTIAAFNNMFAGIHEKIRAVKGDEGTERYAATLRKQSFQRAGVFSGVDFEDGGLLPPAPILANVAQLPEEERLKRLKGTLDRLLAQLVVQLDAAYDAEDKKAVSELIAREKATIAEG